MRRRRMPVPMPLLLLIITALRRYITMPLLRHYATLRYCAPALSALRRRAYFSLLEP